MKLRHLFKNKFFKIVLVTFLFAGSAVALSGCGKQSANTVKVGIVGSDPKKIWDPLKNQLKKQGVHVKLVTFSDYTQPNNALRFNEINANEFQTKQYLDNYNRAHHSKLDPVAKSIISPFSIYSDKVSKISQLKRGAKIAFPNNAVDEGRALHALSEAGLIKYKHVQFPTPKDITSNRKHLKFETLDAPQVPRALKDVDAALIDGNFALDAHLSPSHIIYHEKLSKFDKPYVNYIVINRSNNHKKAIKKIIRAYHSKQNQKRIQKEFKGYDIPAWNLKL